MDHLVRKGYWTFYIWCPIYLQLEMKNSHWKSCRNQKCTKIYQTVVAFLKFLLNPIPSGAKYLKECPQQNYIPLYLLVCGVFTMVLFLFNSLPCEQNDNPALKCLCTIWNSLVTGFTLCWFIAGEKSCSKETRKIWRGDWVLNITS